MKSKKDILSLLQTAESNYQSKCVEKKPGNTGVKRKKHYEEILAKLSKEDLFNEGWQELTKFYQDNHATGRLMEEIQKALWDIFELELPASPKSLRFIGGLATMHYQAGKLLEQEATRHKMITAALEQSCKKKEIQMVRG